MNNSLFSKAKTKLGGLWDATKHGAQTLFGPPTEEQVEGMTQEEANEYAKSKRKAQVSALEGLSELITNAWQEDAPVPRQKKEYDIIEPIQTRPAQEMPRLWRPNQVNNYPWPKLQDVSQASLDRLVPTLGNTRDVERQSLYDSRSFNAMVPGVADDPVVVHEGMSERAVSDFGVFRQGPKNTVGLLSRRSNDQALAARSGGNRG